MESRILLESPELAILGISTISLGYIYNKTAVITVSILYLAVMIYFYRDPCVTLDLIHGETTLKSPAYGTISRIINRDKTTLISIFLSPLDIHLQYYPCNGRILTHIYDNTGKFAIASDAYKSDKNEKIITILVTNDMDMIKIVQIAGMLVRQISTIPRINSNVHQGEYLGMIKFGSRVDLEFPIASYRLMPNIREGVYVTANTLLCVKR